MRNIQKYTVHVDDRSLFPPQNAQNNRVQCGLVVTTPVKMLKLLDSIYCKSCGPKSTFQPSRICTVQISVDVARAATLVRTMHNSSHAQCTEQICTDAIEERQDRSECQVEAPALALIPLPLFVAPHPMSAVRYNFDDLTMWCSIVMILVRGSSKMIIPIF